MTISNFFSDRCFNIYEEILFIPYGCKYVHDPGNRSFLKVYYSTILLCKPYRHSTSEEPNQTEIFERKNFEIDNEKRSGESADCKALTTTRV